MFGQWGIGQHWLRLHTAAPLYVRVNIGLSSIFGDTLGLTYSVVDEFGTVVPFGSGLYSNLTGTSGSGLFTLGQRPNAGNNSVSYLTGLQLTGK